VFSIRRQFLDQLRDYRLVKDYAWWNSLISLSSWQDWFIVLVVGSSVSDTGLPSHVDIITTWAPKPGTPTILIWYAARQSCLMHHSHSHETGFHIYNSLHLVCVCVSTNTQHQLAEGKQHSYDITSVCLSFCLCNVLKWLILTNQCHGLSRPYTALCVYILWSYALNFDTCFGN